VTYGVTAQERAQEWSTLRVEQRTSEQTCAVPSKLANFANMRTVRVGELRNHLSRYLQMVKNGGRVVVLERETPIAELGPATSGRAASRETHEDLVRRGVLIPAPRPSLSLEELGAPIRCRGDALAALRADRDEH
jgi:antitoxin (DNA-binding transcriptional repressor) of toxin-antitoxin stability system